MVMSSFQPMTPVLCQVVPYSPLETNDEYKERNFSSTIEDTLHPIIEDVLDDVASSDEDID